MRKRLRGSILLKECFNLAWRCIPDDLRGDLSSFIRYVDNVDTIEGTCLSIRNPITRSVEPFDGPLDVATAYAGFYQSESRAFCDVLLSSDPLEQGTKAFIIAIILHELGHVYDYFLKGKAIADISDYDAEQSAWIHATEWVTSNEALSGELLKESLFYCRYGVLFPLDS